MELYFTKNIGGDTAILPEEESYHCIKILRNKANDIIHFTNGEGAVFKGKIKDPNSKRCVVSIKEEITLPHDRNYFAHVAIAPTKNIDRIEFFVEKAVEIGIDKISFLRCERSERKDVKLERMNKIAVSAMKQSKKARLPVIEEMISFKEFIKKEYPDVEKYIASLTDVEQVSLKNLERESKYLLLVGPEGDFTPNEVAMAIDNGYKPLTLGNNIYRTETAGLVACSYMQFINL